MSQTSWHVGRDVLSRFYADPASVDDVTASSIEAHLVSCDVCRAELTAFAPQDWLATSWDSVADQVDRPRATPMEWVLDRLGMRGGIARLVAATPALQLAGLAATLIVAVAAVVMSVGHGTDGPFLALAPLTPLAAVYISFAPTREPGGEAGVATPLNGAGLVVRRTAVVLAVTLGVLAVGALALPSLDANAAAWVLPALALSLGALALATWISIEVAVVSLAVGWLAVLSVASVAGPRTASIVDSATFSAVGQLFALVAVVVSLVVVVVRRDTFATSEARS